MAVQTDARGVIVECATCGQKNRIAFGRLASSTRCGNCKTPLAAPSKPIDVTSTAAFDELIADSPLPVVVDFWAPWCGPCHMVAPEFEKVASTYAGRLLFAKVNTEGLQDLAARYRILSIPTLAIFKGGRQLASETGARPAEGIEQFIRHALGGAW
jgi:thioredoxin 2